MKKTTNALNSTHDVTLKIPDFIMIEFQKAAQKISEENQGEIIVEQLMTWMLSGITSSQIIREFQSLKKSST